MAVSERYLVIGLLNTNHNSLCRSYSPSGPDCVYHYRLTELESTLFWLFLHRQICLLLWSRKFWRISLSLADEKFMIVNNIIIKNTIRIILIKILSKLNTSNRLFFLPKHLSMSVYRRKNTLYVSLILPNIVLVASQITITKAVETLMSLRLRSIKSLPSSIKDYDDHYPLSIKFFFCKNIPNLIFHEVRTP